MANPSKVSTHLEPWCDLEDKVVLITGALLGLGWDFCITLAKASCKVIATARRANRLKSLCDQINQSSSTPRAVALALDVTADAPAIEAAVEKAWAAFGHINCLINNAGIRGDALNAQKNSLADPNNVLQSWDPTLVNPCTWFHVMCNSENSVTRMVDLI